MSTFPELTCHSVEDLHIEHPRIAALHHQPGRYGHLWARGNSLIGKGTNATHLQSRSPKNGKKLRSRNVHWIWNNEPQPCDFSGRKRFINMACWIERTYCTWVENLDFMNDPEASTNKKNDDRHQRSISRDAAIILPTPCRTGRKDGWTRNRSETQRTNREKNGEICRWVPACPTYFIGRPYKCTGCPSRHHYRAERMGRHESDILTSTSLLSWKWPEEGILTRAEAKRTDVMFSLSK